MNLVAVGILMFGLILMPLGGVMAVDGYRNVPSSCIPPNCTVSTVVSTSTSTVTLPGNASTATVTTTTTSTTTLGAGQTAIVTNTVTKTSTSTSTSVSTFTYTQFHYYTVTSTVVSGTTVTTTIIKTYDSTTANCLLCGGTSPYSTVSGGGAASEIAIGVVLFVSGMAMVGLGGFLLRGGRISTP